jgi:hypothetical protein
MTIPNSTVNRLFTAAVIVIFSGLLFGGTAPGSADPTGTTLIPTPDPSEGGGVHRSPDKGGANSSIQHVPPPPTTGPCFNCTPHQIPNGAAAPGPGPAPTLTPPVLGSNSGVPAKATNLVIWGDHFHPGDAVYLEVRGNDGTLYWHQDGVKADGAGAVKVTTSRGTDSATPINGGPAGPAVVDH